ncbi:hypothetical protein [Iodobacter ciconiae]|uniref:Uncharacterized protein n=1 Tax=Iodobacter ciconiae TaxID=2496266 RepID=A0A3S8ZRJ0_9NEIS|nr:hypothetical protein [Iodobacter ciconiae]AZN36084.1 hypothetical protein EJO50_06090 [Iodobacter ciconiae]
MCNWIKYGITSVAFFSSLAQADNLSLLAGGMSSAQSDQTSYAWALSYMHDLNEDLAVSFSWVNEGHVDDHHRDGHAFQLWGKTKALHPNLMLAAGLGPYRYFDTTRRTVNSHGYLNEHGWGGIFSVQATWQGESNWQYQLRLNHIQTPSSIDTNSVMLGMGYQLSPMGFDEADWPGSRGRQEVALYLGQTIVNSFGSELADAAALEYRYAFVPGLKASAAFIQEGETDHLRRSGIALQAWYEPSFFDDKFSVGLGIGPYFSLGKRYRNNQPDIEKKTVSGLVTLASSYRFSEHWRARVAWNRTVTSYDKDTDVILLGLGYLF